MTIYKEQACAPTLACATKLADSQHGPHVDCDEACPQPNPVINLNAAFRYAGRTPTPGILLKFYNDAALMWNAGKDTHDIARHFGVDEALIYRRIENIKKAAHALRLSLAQALDQSIQNCAHAFKSHIVSSPPVTGGVVMTAADVVASHHHPPPSLVQINHITHHSLSAVRSSCNQTNNGKEGHSDGQISHG